MDMYTKVVLMKVYTCIRVCEPECMRVFVCVDMYMYTKVGIHMYKPS